VINLNVLNTAVSTADIT